MQPGSLHKNFQGKTPNPHRSASRPLLFNPSASTNQFRQYNTVDYQLFRVQLQTCTMCWEKFDVIFLNDHVQTLTVYFWRRTITNTMKALVTMMKLQSIICRLYLVETVKNAPPGWQPFNIIRTIVDTQYVYHLFWRSQRIRLSSYVHQITPPNGGWSTQMVFHAVNVSLQQVHKTVCNC